MRSSMLLTLALTLSACSATLGDSTPPPALTLTGGVHVQFDSASLTVTNRTTDHTEVCVTTIVQACTTLPPGMSAALSVRPDEITALVVPGATLTANPAGVYAVPTGYLPVTTERLVRYDGQVVRISDNLPGQGEQWREPFAAFTDLVVEERD